MRMHETIRHEISIVDTRVSETVVMSQLSDLMIL